MANVKEFVQSHRGIVAATLLAVGGIGYGAYHYYGPNNHPVNAAEAIKHPGERQVMEITVGSSLVTAKHALLNEGKFPKETMTVRITPENPAFANCTKGKDTMVGRRIKVQGVMGSYNGKPQFQVGAGDKVEIQ